MERWRLLHFGVGARKVLKGTQNEQGKTLLTKYIGF